MTIEVADAKSEQQIRFSRLRHGPGVPRLSRETHNLSSMCGLTPGHQAGIGHLKLFLFLILGWMYAREGKTKAKNGAGEKQVVEERWQMADDR